MGVEITGKKGTVSVGEKIEVGIKYTKEWGVLKSVEWTIPGKVIFEYVDGAASAKVTPLPDADKKKSVVVFRWVDGGDGRSVEAKCVFTSKGADVNKTVSATFDVKRPKLDKLDATTDSVRLRPAGAPTYIGFGDVKPGIVWHWKISANGAAEGELKDIQLAKAAHKKTTTAGVKQVWTLPGMKVPSGIWFLDNENPYGSTGFWGAAKGGPWKLPAGGSTSDTGISDSPGTPLAGRTVSTIDYQFQYFLLYRSKEPDAHWIPIGKIEWSCKGTATLGAAGWVVSGASGSAGAGAETFDFPEFTKELISSLSWENE